MIFIRPIVLRDPTLQSSVDHKKRVFACAVYLCIHSTIVCWFLAHYVWQTTLYYFDATFSLPPSYSPFFLCWLVLLTLLFILAGIGLVRFQHWGWLLTVSLCGVAILACFTFCVDLIARADGVSQMIVLSSTSSLPDRLSASSLIYVAGLMIYFVGLPSGLILYALAKAKTLFGVRRPSRP